MDKCLKPPKDTKKRQKQVSFSERDNFASQKECKNSDNDNDQYIYIYIYGMYV